AQIEGKPECIINVKYAGNIYALCFGKDYVFCGSIGLIVVYKWTTPTDGFLKYHDTVHLTSGNLYATVSEFSTSSEDGTVCFWDNRVIQNGNFKASSVFKPYLNSELSRSKLGSWLTTLSCKQFEEDWFVTGGGPRLSLWSRRAGRNVSILHPEGISDTWYSQTAIFCDMDNDSRIVSGGNSSLLYMWDHVGNLLASVDLHDPPNSRLSHILVVDKFNLSESVDSFKLKYHSNCAFFVGGCSPVIRLIANLGYPLGIPNKKSKCFIVNNKLENDPSNQQYHLNKSNLNLYSSNNLKEIWFDNIPHALIANSMQDQSATTKSLVKLTSFSGPTRRIAMDCEFVGVGFEGKDDALARVSIVNQFGHTLLDAYVRPEERVVDYRTKFSGIRPRDLRKNGPARAFNDVHKEVAELIKNKVLVGHSILKDLKVLRLSHPRRFIRDTSRYRPFRDLFNGRIPSLKALTQKVLGVNVQSGEHDSVEDARATMRLYTSVKRVWESSKKHRTSKTEQVKKNINLEKQGVLNVKDEYESGLHEEVKCHKSQQQQSTTSIKNSIHKFKQWDPIRNRKCSKNRMKFLNRHRSHKRKHTNTQSNKST
ncbi:unnamed protein product, partial [Schistosoma margrebowiei]